MNQQTKLSERIGPVVVLFILSPIIAELFSGSTPVSRGGELIFESLFYGPGAILVREWARRYQRGWLSILVLGLAFGVVEECLLLQSAFNPHFLNYDIAYGRVWGVNWIWSEIIITNHAIWSITLPIVFTEVIFPKRKDSPWLNKAGIGIFLVLFILSGIGFYIIFYKMSGYVTTVSHFVVAGILAVALMVLAFRLPKEPMVTFRIKTPPPIILGIDTFLVGMIWLHILTLVFREKPDVPAWLAALVGVVLLVAYGFVVLGWKSCRWNKVYRFALVSGTLYAEMVFGLVSLVSQRNWLDILSQIGFILMVSILILVRRKKITSDITI